MAEIYAIIIAEKRKEYDKEDEAASAVYEPFEFFLHEAN